MSERIFAIGIFRLSILTDRTASYPLINRPFGTFWIRIYVDKGLRPVLVLGSIFNRYF